MTPKEKAKELIQKMYDAQTPSRYVVQVYDAKQCALIAADTALSEFSSDSLNGIAKRDYWEHVIIALKEME
jgi:hypothetical protein